MLSSLKSTTRALAAFFAAALVIVLLPAVAGSVGAASAAPKCTIAGNGKTNVLTGGPGADVICGRGGNDFLFGLDGNDQLVGGAGDDQLEGGEGNDTLDGRDSARSRDILECGPGEEDRALADSQDVVQASCEFVEQSEPGPDRP